MRLRVLATGSGEDSIVKIVLVRQLNLAFRNHEVELLLNLRSLQTEIGRVVCVTIFPSPIQT